MFSNQIFRQKSKVYKLVLKICDVVVVFCMGLRPGKVYRNWERPYTRQATKRPRKSYVRGVPGSKLRIHVMGNRKETFEATIHLVTKKQVQIRHNALEAGRIAANAYLKKHLEEDNYFLKMRVYPHHIMREHAQAAIAQADRFYQGMSHPFGKPNGVAARVRLGQPIMSVNVNKKDESTVREALRRAGDKMPCSCCVEVEKK